MISPFWRQASIAVGTYLASFSIGASMGFAGVLLYQLRSKDSDIELDLDSASWIGSIHGLAGIPGIIAPITMQWKGRKFTFIASCCIVIIGWALLFLANNISTILIAETLLGFSANVIMAVSYDTLSEMITPEYRNVVTQYFGTVNALGVATAGIMTKFLYWRTQIIILCLPAVISVVISYTWLESPLWLAYKKEFDNCKTNFIKLRGTKDHSVKELQEVMAAAQKSNVTKRYDTIRRFIEQVTSRDFIMPALHVVLLLNHSHWSGTVVTLIYSIEVISTATQNETAAFIGGIATNLFFVISTIISSVLIRFYNNKPVILVSTSGATVCLLCVSIVTYLQGVGVIPMESLLTLYYLVGFTITSGLGQSSVVFTMSSELMPVKHRGLGGTLYIISACALCASALKISPYLFAYLGLWATYLIYTLNSMICGFLIWKYVPETKGKTLQEIEHFYNNGTFEINLQSIEEAQPIDVNKL